MRREWQADPDRIARFLTKLVFCLFAEDIGLLPTGARGERGIFSEIVEQTRHQPDDFQRYMHELFAAMNDGGHVLYREIPYFDGTLFANVDVERLSLAALNELDKACHLDWSSVEPAIFGTLFERSLDPSKRSQLGAHYTSRADILLIVEPVLMEPLRREWAAIKAEAETLRPAFDDPTITPAVRIKRGKDLEALRMKMLQQVRDVTVLDPAAVVVGGDQVERLLRMRVVPRLYRRGLRELQAATHIGGKSLEPERQLWLHGRRGWMFGLKMLTSTVARESDRRGADRKMCTVTPAGNSGADVVITGRVADPSIFMAPMMHEFGWSAGDYNRIAAGIVAGHINECGAQASGGNCLVDWETIPDLAGVGYPIIEAEPDGSFVVTKHPDTGGRIDVAVIKEQLLYEMGDPKSYITPDGVADFTTIRLEQVGPDRVRVSGVRGGPRPVHSAAIRPRRARSPASSPGSTRGTTCSTRSTCS